MNPKYLRIMCYAVIAITGVVLVSQSFENSEKDTESERDKVQNHTVVDDASDEEDMLSEKNKTQEGTFFYRLQYVINKGEKNNGAENSGQFITFTKDECFESDKYGEDAGNGHMSLIGDDLDGLAKVYKGVAYWGDGCTFVFKSDRRTLHVETPFGMKFVYRRSTPPQGMTTCSFLRSRDEEIRAIVYQESLELERQTNDLNRRDRTSKKVTNPYKDFSCPYCNGTGKVKYTPSVSSYGISAEYYVCKECGEKTNTPHSHVTCGECGGRGRIKY